MLDTHVVARSFTDARVHAVESSPAGERNHPAALAHRPEPPAASALVAATAGWSARALPASKTDGGGLTDCPRSRDQ